MRGTALTLLMLWISVTAWGAETSYVPGELLIQRPPGTDWRSLSEDFRNAELQPVRLLSSHLGVWLCRFTPKRGADRDLLEAVRAHDGVALAQFNHYVSTRETIPDDEFFDLQWALHNTGQTGGLEDADVDAPEAWNITTGGLSALGDTLVVAIIDEGFSLVHEDLYFWKNYAETPGNGVDDDRNGYIDDFDGWDAYNHDGMLPTNSHGTHVCGIAGARGNNGVGVSGVNWNVQTLPVAGASSTESTVIEAYGYVIAQRDRWDETNGAEGALVVATNASFGVDLGDPDDFPLWCAIYDSLGARGILSCGATANHNWDIDVVGDVPTACPSEFLISVTSTNDLDERHPYHAYGATAIDLGAPGISIYSTCLENGYCYKQGTSMATPHVTGAIALLMSAASPEVMMAYHARPAEMARRFRDCILDGVDPIETLEGLTVTGGRLNLRNSIELLPRVLSDAPERSAPASLHVLSSRPNPIRGTTTLSFTVADAASRVHLSVLDPTGRAVRSLVDGAPGAGEHSVSWDGSDAHGRPMPAGIYFARLDVEGHPSASRQMILLR